MATVPEPITGQSRQIEEPVATLPNPAEGSIGLVPDESPLHAINWAALGWFGALLLGTYYPILSRLVNQWLTDEDVGHGFFVPLVALWIVWQRRERLLRIPWVPAWWGLGLLAWGAGQAYLGVVGAELFLQRTAFIISLVGMLLVMGGTALVRELLFPLCLLPFMIPLPTVIYNKITFPLQIFASQVAEFTLDTIGIPVLRDGNILELANQKLSVAEACSGIRSLLTLTFFSQVYAYFFDRRIWVRWALLLCTIPIAIIANAGRVSLTGVLAYYDPATAEGLFHEMEGFVLFAIAVVMMVCAHQLIRFAASVGGGKRVDGSQPQAEPDFD